MMFIYTFLKYGRPNEEAMQPVDEFEAVQPAS